MIDVTPLPHYIAAINATTVGLLAAGHAFIRSGRKPAHRACMIAAVAVSVLFVVVYLTYHFNAGLARFGGTGSIRMVYFTILLGHVALAVAIVPLVPWTLVNALRGRFDRHRKVARVTLPLWLFVAASGVVVYVMAFHLYPDV